MSEIKRLKMVGWYDPRQLARTGWEVIVSAMFGKHADKRVIQAIADNGSTKKRLYHEIVEDGSGEFGSTMFRTLATVSTRHIRLHIT